MSNLSTENSTILIIEQGQALESEGILSYHSTLGELVCMLLESLFESESASHLLEPFKGDTSEGVLQFGLKVSLGLRGAARIQDQTLPLDGR